MWLVMLFPDDFSTCTSLINSADHVKAKLSIRLVEVPTVGYIRALETAQPPQVTHMNPPRPLLAGMNIQIEAVNHIE